MPDGRFLVVEDEKQHPFSLVIIDPAGGIHAAPLGPGFLEAGSAFWKLDDLEGLAMDPSGNLYAITSHSRNDEGDEKKSRDKLVRFRIAGDRVVDTRVVMELKPALRATHPLLAAAAEIRDVKGEGGLNIEALEFSVDQRRLLLGFRSPLLDNLAIIAAIENPGAMLEPDPRISPDLITLGFPGRRDSRHGLFPRPRRLPGDRRPHRPRAGAIPALVLERSGG